MRNMALLAVVLAACGSSRPAFDDKLVAPGAKGLKVGASTLDDVTKMFPDAKVTKDKSLGGDQTVMYNDHKAISVNAKGFDGYVIDGKLAQFEMAAPGACEWLVSTVGAMKGSTSCPGNRKMGASKDHSSGAYCASAGDRVVWIDCRGDSIEYRVGE